MNSWAPKAAKVLQTLCGWVLVYFSIGAAAGFLFDRPYADTQTCLPFTSVFGVLETNCSNKLADIAWMVAVEIPRLAIVVPAVSLAFVVSSITHGGHRWLEALRWLALSVPLFLAAYAGFVYWRRRSLRVALLLVGALGTEVALLGTGM
jgi:hypothetical protein